MKINKSQLKQIIKEEISKTVSVGDLYLAEMFDTGAAGPGMSGEEKKKLCNDTHGEGSWIEPPGGYGYCKKPIQEELEEVNEASGGRARYALADVVGDMTVLADGATDAATKDELNRIIGDLNEIRYMLG